MSDHISITAVNELIEEGQFFPPDRSALVLDTYPTKVFSDALREQAKMEQK